jgi:thiamine-phosphate pyrophosphorylase
VLDGPTARVYLIAPASPGAADLPDRLGRLLDRFDVACVRLGAGPGSEGELARAAEALRPACHARDVPLVLTDHFLLAKELGLDGVHLSDGPRQVRAARKALGFDAIVGAHARASRHDAMTAAEIGADYVSFGPLTASRLGDGTVAPVELLEWWAEMIEVPLVAEGGLTPELAATLAHAADFLALGDELWSHGEGPEAALRAFTDELGRQGVTMLNQNSKLSR